MKLLSATPVVLRARRNAAWLLSFSLGVLGAWAAEKGAPDLTATPAVTERGLHHRLWEWTTPRTLPDGTVSDEKHSYTELQTGMHYLKNGELTESSERIELLQDGAIAEAGQHQVIFAANVNSDNALVLFTPDGKKLRSRVVGLAYYDAQSGGAVWVSLVKDSIGALLGDNQVLYEDAFADVKADVRYTYTRHGLEQDVILRQNDLPPPAAFGLNPNSTRLEVITEFLQPPVPALQEGVVEQEKDTAVRRTMATPDFSDQVISFGDMHIGQGKAFMLGGETTEIAVGKSWTQIGERTFLVEAVKFEEVRTRVETLPKAVAPNQRQAQKAQPQKDLFAGIAPAPEKKPGKLLRMAQLPKSNQGLVLDYSAVTSQPDLTFKGDTTYYVTGPVNLSGTTTIEGGAIIKYANTGSPQITINSAGSSIQCLTAPYHPAIFTAKDDNTVGETISGSTGNPSGTYAITALSIDANGIASDVNLSNLRFRYAQTAVYLYTHSHTLSHIQFLNCTYAINPPYATVTLRNILANQIASFFYYCYGTTVNGEHLTLHNIGSLYAVYVPTVKFTNSLLVQFTTSPVGSYTAVNSPYIPNDGGVFQAVGSGSHYLADNTYRNGTPNISSVMLSDLATRTTYAPQQKTAGTYSTDWIVSPTAQRDNDGSPDCGYHYEPLDWLATGVTMSSYATVIVTNGAALGIQNNGGAGISLADYAKFISQGSAANQNFVGRVNLVQEQPSSATAGWYPIVNSSSSYCSFRFRHTILPALAGGQNYYYGGANSFEFTHCELRSGQLSYFQSSSYTRQITLTNNLFFRTALALGANDQNVTLYAYNNLFVGGTLALNVTSGNLWQVKDCVFDKTALSQPYYYYTPIPISGASHNGYVSGYSRISPQQPSSDRVVSSIAYTADQPAKFFVNTPSSFENYGSRTSGDARLFYFSIRADQQKDNGTVDIGLHYAGVGTDGKPLDMDGDSLPDYLEDTDANGSFTTGDLADLGNTDSDGDGLPDAYEYFTTLTSPRIVDTGTTGTSDGYKDSDVGGGDGLTNQEEFQSGKNPLVPDVATPLFSPVGGTYASAQTVTITCPTAGATIRYTLDGTEPTTSSTAYSAPFSVAVNKTLKAKAFKAGWTSSDTESEGYQTAANAAPTISVLPPSGLTFGASDSIEILVQGADSDGTITKLQLYRGNLKVAEAIPGPLRFTLRNVPAGTYAFIARAIDDKGAVTISSSVSVTINSPGPVVSLVGAKPFFTSSPGALLANITGVNPAALTSLTLNGNAVPLRAGSFMLFPALTAGENTFTLTVNGSASATTKVYLDSVAPTISIGKPANNSTFNTTRVNVTGAFTETSLKRITVNGVLAFVTGSGTFEARNVPLVSGANTVTATVEDIAGNTAAATITVTGGATLVDPVQLAAAPIAGFDPLTVTFSIPLQNVSGTAYIDFEGSGTQTAMSANHVYSAGQYFPVVTIQNGNGDRFSSLGGWNADSALRVNVQQPPGQFGSPISIQDPVDLKVGGPSAHLYVLSRSGTLMNEYDAGGAFVRSKAALGTAPTGLDVDSAGNVYVAIGGDHQVAKYKLNGGSYQLDTAFNGTGLIGRSDKASGFENGEFNTPFDVAVTPDGEEIAVSDSGNHRIQRFTKDGVFVDTFGGQGSGVGQFNTPKGVTYDSIGYLYIVDSGNNRIALARLSVVVGFSGTSGTTLGEFQGAINVGVGSRGIYVADTGNDRIEIFDAISGGHGIPITPLNPRLGLSSQLSLNDPNSIAPGLDLLEEKIYIADTGNHRVLLAKLASGSPDPVWSLMKQRVSEDDINGAIASFSSASAEQYRLEFLSIGLSELKPLISGIPALTPVFIENDKAQYRFERMVQGFAITFPVDFVKENGIWKIARY